MVIVTFYNKTIDVHGFKVYPNIDFFRDDLIKFLKLKKIISNKTTYPTLQDLKLDLAECKIDINVCTQKIRYKSVQDFVNDFRITVGLFKNQIQLINNCIGNEINWPLDIFKQEEGLIMTNEERDYVDYVENHINNVYKTFTLLNDILHKFLHYDDLDLIKRINRHDASKWSDEEFEGYRQYFFPNANEEKNQEIFDKAWKHHYTNNDHHPQYWNNASMPDDAIAEMICDWAAMSLNFGTSLKTWYEEEFEHSKLHPDTLAKVDSLITMCDAVIERENDAK